jgi:molybdopterin synthase catalytic subunit
MSFRLTAAAIEPSKLMEALRDVRTGACVTFEGRVRDINEGRAVRALEYEAYAPLAESEGARILAEALGRFPVTQAVCVHRTGNVALGEIAVWVAVTSAHRAAAFEACSFIIAEVKTRVPMWKKEYYADGKSEWVNCASGEAKP